MAVRRHTVYCCGNDMIYMACLGHLKCLMSVNWWVWNESQSSEMQWWKIQSVLMMPGNKNSHCIVKSNEVEMVPLSKRQWGGTILECQETELCVQGSLWTRNFKVELVQMYFSYRAGWMCDMQSRQHTMLRKRKFVCVQGSLWTRNFKVRIG